MNNKLINALKMEILGFYYFELLIVILFTLFLLIFRGFFSRIIVSRIKKFVKITNNKIDDELFTKLEKPLNFLPLIFVTFLISLFIDQKNNFFNLINNFNLSLISLIIFWFLYNLVEPLSLYINKLDKLLTKELIIWLIKSLKVFFVFLGGVAILEIWGVKVGPILAGLGLIGVAVALGAQDLFKNLISGILIIAERRFKIGDVIKVPGHTQGTVEYIGFRSTLIREFDSTPITIPNYIFAEAPILNFSSRFNRRINWIIGLEYGSKIKDLKKFTQEITSFIEKSENFIVNENFKCFVRVDKFNDSSIDMLVNSFTSTNDWEKYLIIKEELAFKIKQTADEIGLNFAFPSQSIYIEKNN